MRIGMPLAYSGGFTETADRLTDYERAGLDVVLLPEAYSFDSVSQLGYLAARTSTLEIASNILNIYSRTPALLAMTAAGLDYISDGRFTLGIGASGPQVVEGFHGVPYTSPLARTREVVEICRKVWRREPVEHTGTFFHLPLDRDHGGSGIGKPLKLINEPVRERIPMTLAALGPRNVALAAELFEGWEPIFFYPEAARTAFGDALDAGLALRDPSLGALRIAVDTQVAVVEDEAEMAEATGYVRRQLALYMGGMGARGKNFYNDLARRYGFDEAAATVQDLYLSGHRAEAAAAVPDALVHGVSLIGPIGRIRERVAAFALAGVTQLNARPLAATHAQRVRDIGLLKEAAT
ncbi:LLM class F420-dependent oxidoreductase [Streptomyces sp. NPDC091292]|uniref:LLM class F420-dependent oxidoreductase n=1 Tax=Streptomyces sp. NPDC091292 TaxID=3365991 RepID=UPI003821CCEB